MNVTKLVPQPVERLQFHLRAKKYVPAQSGCYVLTTFDGFVLYVGLATSLASRFVQHCETKEKCEPTSDGRAFWFHFLEVEAKELNRVERTWLNQFSAVHGRRPILNKVDSPMYG